jgi:hypothetical protein
LTAAKSQSQKGPDDLLPLIPVIDPIIRDRLFVLAKEKRGLGENKVRGFIVGVSPEEAKRFAEAKQIRLQKWHEEWLGKMHEHAKRSPWATAWLLERNFPELYALREFVRPVAKWQSADR